MEIYLYEMDSYGLRIIVISIQRMAFFNNEKRRGQMKRDNNKKMMPWICIILSESISNHI